MLSMPDGIPLPLREGYGFAPVSPIKRTPMSSGRARQRRRFLSVPTYPSVTWLCNAEQAQLFEGWVKWAIGYAGWFMCPLKTPLGLAPAKVRFTEDLYQGPELVGVNHWRFTTTLEAYEMLVVTEAELADLIAGMDIGVMNGQLRALLERWYTRSWTGAA